MSTILFFSLRTLHVLLAATWLGATAFASLFLLPAVTEAGAASGQVMIELHRKGLPAFFAAAGGTTVLTGLYLFWHFTGGFEMAISGSHAGIAFSVGGLAGLIALIIGGAFVGRGLKKVVDVMEQAAKTTDASQKATLMMTATELTRKITTFATIVLLCQVVALILMAIAHYI